jgi:hypothetical protein
MRIITLISWCEYALVWQQLFIIRDSDFKFNLNDMNSIFMNFPLVGQLLSWDSNYSYSSQQTLAYKTWEFERKDGTVGAEEESVACIPKFCK